MKVGAESARRKVDRILNNARLKVIRLLQPMLIWVLYLRNLLHLWRSGSIDTRILVFALKNRPVAVCGNTGGFIVDPAFEVGEGCVPWYLKREGVAASEAVEDMPQGETHGS